MTAPGLIIAAPRSGAGKTTLTLALLAALRRRGLVVQAAKVGPDYIDPSFHAAATGRPSFNLDSWAMPPSLIDALVAENAAHADLLVIEGAMGLFDGVPAPPLRTGASADLAARLGLPVLLVIDVAGQSQSAAALVRGFASHQRDVRIAGVVLNRVGSARHVRLVADAIAALDIPVLGAIPRDASLALPERHLGLVQAAEHANLAARLDHLADMAEYHLDLDAIKQLAVPPHRSAARLDAPVPPPGQRIAWRETTLSASSIRMCWRVGSARAPRSSPSRRSPTRRRRRTATVAGSPAAIRSCMPERWPPPIAIPCRLDAVRRDAAGAWRVRRLHGARREPEDADGVSHRMAGLLGHATSFAHRKLHLGYRQARLLADSPLGKPGTLLRGHEFHYAALTTPGQDEPLAELADSQGERLGVAGGRRGNVTGTFFHAIAKV